MYSCMVYLVVIRDKSPRWLLRINLKCTGFHAANFNSVSMAFVFTIIDTTGASSITLCLVEQSIFGDNLHETCFKKNSEFHGIIVHMAIFYV